MELGWRGHNIGDGAGSEDRRKEVPPPSTILQASRGAERRRKYLAGGAWGRWRSAGFERSLFKQEYLYPVRCVLWAGQRKLRNQLSAGGLGRVELQERESFKIQIVRLL